MTKGIVNFVKYFIPFAFESEDRDIAFSSLKFAWNLVKLPETHKFQDEIKYQKIITTFTVEFEMNYNCNLLDYSTISLSILAIY